MWTMHILTILVGLAVLAFLFWCKWTSPNRRCAECGSRLTIRYRRSTSGPDSHRNKAWHVYHHVHCFYCKANTANKELTFQPPQYLRDNYEQRLRRRTPRHLG